MVPKHAPGNKTYNAHSRDAAEKDRLIVELKDRIAVLENELRSKQDAASSGIADSKLAEKTLRAGEERYRSLIESTGDWVWETDEDFVLTYDSPMGRKIMGYGPDEVIGRTPYSLMPKDEFERVKLIAGPAISRHDPIQRIENRLIKKDGSIATVETSAIPLFDESGHYRGYRGVNHDITERKQAEDALRESEERYRNLVENVNDIVWETDGRFVFTYISPNILKAWGYPAEEVMGKTPMDFMPPDEARRISLILEDVALKRDKLLMFGNHQVRRDGSTMYLEVSGQPIIDNNGVYRGYRGTARDVTERKRAQEAIIQSQQMLQLVMDNIPQAIFWKDRNSTYIGCNKVFARATGLTTPGDIRGKTDFDLPWSRKQADFFRECDRIVMENDAPEYHIVERQREASGRTAWIETNKIPLHDAQGNVTGVLCMYEDVTERKLAEEALRRSEEGLKKSQEIAHLGNWELDLVNNRLTWSDEVYRIFGLRPQEFSATYEAFLQAVHPDDRAAVDAAYSASVREGRDMYEYEHRIVRKSDGEVRFVHEKCEHIRDEHSKIIRSMGMVHDITERRLAEEALRETKAEAELYVDLMGHDINNMNQVSMGFLELAHDLIEMNGKLGEDNIVLLEKAMDSLRDSSQLIDSVRKLQRERMGMYEPQVLDVGAVIEEAIRHFDKIPGRDVKITYGQDEHYLVEANGLLKDVFINLIGNAVKHSRGPLAVDIYARRAEENGKKYCRVDVSDNGPGIPDALKATLFDRLNLATTRAKGKGFGLCLIKLLVDDYHGRFWAEDRVEGDYTRGARFVVMLPAVE